jgi:ATP-dependent DNA helicase PIF1
MRQQQALAVMLSGRSVFLTGAPGAGKTYVLNEFIRRAQREGKSVAVTASTGIAATHIGGATIHSWSGLGIRDVLTQLDCDILSANAMLRKRYIATDVLVIDEVSMLHGKRLDMLNEIAKLFRENDEPFGGMQVILVGDLFQLPPVSRGNEPDDFVHQSTAWEELALQICYINEQHRQAGDRLLDILEAMRRGELDEWHVEALQERLTEHPPSDEPVTRLYSHNIDVDSINARHLGELRGSVRTFRMLTQGPAAKVEQLTRSVLAPEQLELKVGAEVMFVANDFAHGYVNGSRGRILEFKSDTPIVQLLHSNRLIAVEPYSWALTEDGKKRAEVTQLPLRLAWAITIHKSQGMSLDAAEIDLGRSFTPGMGYVALSRVRSLNGVYLTSINAMALKLHPAIFVFDAEARNASDVLAAQTSDATVEEKEKLDAPQPTASPDIRLLEKLKVWRRRRAQADSVPAYIIAHDTMLVALATTVPRTEQQLLAVPGVGMRKIELYGDDLLQILKATKPKS